MNKIRRNLYEIGNAKNLSTSKIKEIEKNFFKLEKNLSISQKSIMIMMMLNIKE